MASEDIKLQLKRKEEELEKWKSQLDKLFRQKAQTAIKREKGIGDRDVLASKIKRLDSEITAAKEKIEYLPFEIQELQTELQAVEKRESEIQKIIPKQQQVTDEIIQTSEWLVKHLLTAKQSNDKLKRLYASYRAYEKDTGKKLLPNKGTCCPSSTFLNSVYETLSRELKGEIVARTLGTNRPL